ncbi:MAG: hypothetical protein RL095_1151 [Verrucomicrobiota bacterium]|jgi:hypothetical protein
MLLLYPSSQIDPRAPDEICAEESAVAANLGLCVAQLLPRWGASFALRAMNPDHNPLNWPTDRSAA